MHCRQNFIGVMSCFHAEESWLENTVHNLNANNKIIFKNFKNMQM